MNQATVAAILEDLRKGGVEFKGAMVEHDGWLAVHGVDGEAVIPPGLVSEIERYSLVDIEGNKSEKLVFRVTREEVQRRNPKKPKNAPEPRRRPLRHNRG